MKTGPAPAQALDDKSRADGRASMKLGQKSPNERPTVTVRKCSQFFTYPSGEGHSGVLSVPTAPPPR